MSNDPYSPSSSIIVLKVTGFCLVKRRKDGLLDKWGVYRAAPMVPRRARLKPEDFQTFGYTVGCPGCDQLQMDTDACRNTIETEFDKTEVGKNRLGRAKDRLDAKVVEIVEEIADGPRNPKDVSHEQQQTQLVNSYVFNSHSNV